MSEDITIKKSTYNKFVVGIVLALVSTAFLAGYIVGDFETKTVQSTSQLSNTQTSIQQIPTMIQPQPTPQTRISISIGDSPIMGNPNAPITMIEFSDFQCPFCGQFFSQTLMQVEKNYIESGKVKLVFKNFPLENVHPNAFVASLAAECANEQDKFWKYHDILFENQASWSQLNVTEAMQKFNQYATDSGLDSTVFHSCLYSGKYGDRVNKDLQDGSTYGINGTPAFFIGNDKKGYAELDGAQPFSIFEQKLDSEIG